MGDGERGDGVGEAGGGELIAGEFHESRCKPADEGVARARGVDDLEPRVRGDERVALAFRDEAAAGAECDDHGGHTECAAAGVERSGGERVEGFFVETPATDERDEFRFVGNQHVGMGEHAGIEVSAHWRGVENGDDIGAAGEAENGGVEREIGLVLTDDDAGGAEECGGDVAGGEGGVGPEGDDDLVLSAGIHENRGVARGKFFASDVHRDPFGPEKRRRAAAEGVVAQSADECGGHAGTGGGDGLIGTLATGASDKAADDSFTRGGKLRAVPREVLVKATDDDDRRFHAWTLGVCGGA